MSKTLRVTDSDLSLAFLEHLRRRALARREAVDAPAGSAREPAPEIRTIEAEDRFCVVPLASGTLCLRAGVLADPQSGRWRCLHHVHTLGDIA